MKSLLKLKRAERIARFFFENCKHADIQESYYDGCWHLFIYHRFMLNGECVLNPTHRLFRPIRCSDAFARRYIPAFLPF